MSFPAPQSLPACCRLRQRRWRSAVPGFTYGNTLIHSQTLTSRGLPLRLRDRTSAGASRLDYTYTYDKHANITAIADGVAANKENRSLQYDARDRMTQATAPNQAGAELYDYDILDNVRRAAMTADGLGGYVQDYRYLHDANHRLYRIDNAAGTQQWGFTQNNFGETLTRAGSGKNWSYQWNAAGRITQGQQVYAGTTWENYAYDAHGRRTLSTRNTGTTRHQVYNRAGQLLYVEDTRDNQRIDYIHLGGKLVAQRSRPISTSTATVTYHHTDHISSANVETNTSGTQTHRSLRAPYGDPYNGIYREGPGFAGHVTDTHTNLTYMQQRYYDPVALRFLSPDPVHVSATDGSNFNRYWYANNNPYRFRDPDGRKSKEEEVRPPEPPQVLPPVTVTASSAAPAIPVGGTMTLPRIEVTAPRPQGTTVPFPIWVVRSLSIPVGMLWPSPLGAHPCEMLGGPPCGVMMSGAYQPGYWPGDKGAEEWGRRNGVGANEGRRKFHDIKQGDKGQGGGRGQDKYGVNPETGDVTSPDGEVVGNLGDSK
ncbi:RHS repeat-associated core domain-containing protein [Xanthomonadaceae bacterium XH05]|nr:RHS repeat-associated core domain-containing protein [Xanthomonadaceae bacterium XH05]